MKRYWYLWIVVSCLIGLWTGCKPAGGTDAGEKTLMVSIEPLRYVTQRVAGDVFRVVTLVPKGSSPETYEPTPEQMMRLGGSTAYFCVGELGFERVWLEKFRQGAPRVTFVRAAEGIAPLSGACGQGRAENAADPHVWTSPRNMAVMAQNVCAALCRLDTAHAAVFRANLQATLAEIQTVDDSIRALTAGLPSKAFLIYHPALTYFARDYGLVQFAIETDGKEPSPSQVVRLVELCKAQGVRTVLVQQEFDRKNAALIAREAGASVVTVNPLAYDWPVEMLRIARALSGKAADGRPMAEGME